MATAHLMPQVTLAFIITPSSHVLARTGIIALANAIPDMGAMTKFDISLNDIRAEGGKVLAAGLTGNQVITELNISSNNLGYKFDGNDDTSGVIAIADAIPDMGAMLSLHVGNNGIPKKEMREIIIIAASNESMKILCEVPFKDKTITALDVSGKALSTEGALVVAEYLAGNRALTSLDISDNSLAKYGDMSGKPRHVFGLLIP
jgi:hypothetical protein